MKKTASNKHICTSSAVSLQKLRLKLLRILLVQTTVNYPLHKYAD